MRVISGSLKGKKIMHLQSSNTRPLKDLVKEIKEKMSEPTRGGAQFDE